MALGSAATAEKKVHYHCQQAGLFNRLLGGLVHDYPSVRLLHVHGVVG